MLLPRERDFLILATSWTLSNHNHNRSARASPNSPSVLIAIHLLSQSICFYQDFLIPATPGPHHLQKSQPTLPPSSFPHSPPILIPAHLLSQVSTSPVSCPSWLSQEYISIPSFPWSPLFQVPAISIQHFPSCQASWFSHICHLNLSVYNKRGPSSSCYFSSCLYLSHQNF